MPRVHVFRSSTDPGLYGYTAERSGDALLRARRGGKWTYLTDIAVFPENTQTAVNVADMLGNIERRGYHLFNTAPRSMMQLRRKVRNGQATAALPAGHSG
jgi:hypothetical protein